jgi:SET domain-containing protein
MKIKVIKRNEDGTPLPPTNRKANPRPKKKRSVESTIQDWITERRENNDAEHRSRNSQLATWTDTPAEAA